MIDRLRPATAAPLPCKICGGASELYGVVDFNRNCSEERGVRLPLCGVPIYYRRCPNCGFLFTDAFDDWSADEFKIHIYNDDYKKVDPDYLTARPLSNADAIIRLWGWHKTELSVLDFGGGDGVFSDKLRKEGFRQAMTYDPMIPQYARRPEGKFDVVTSFETFEHLPDPAAGIVNILESLAEPGIVYFTTLLQPPEFNKYGLNWWYVGPRNGHVSIFSRRALTLAWARHGYKLVSLKDHVHFAFRTLPSYLKLASP